MSCVLVVDDESDIRGLVQELLQRAGYDVIEAADGNEGLKRFHAKKPDLVILDVQMPGLDGWGGAGSAERDQVKLYVGYLRRKLGALPGAESPIETVRGFGYKYRAA